MPIRLLARLWLCLGLLLAVRAGAASFAEAMEARKSGDHARAIALFRELSAAEPNNVAYLYQLGTVLGWENRYDESLEVFERALMLEPSDFELRIGRCRVLAWAGRLQEAEQSLEPVRRQYPENAEVLNLMGRIVMWERRFDAAQEIFDGVLARHPNDVDALVGRGDVARFQQLYDEARDYYERARKLNPTAPEIRGRVASVRRSGRWRLDLGHEWSFFPGYTYKDWRETRANLRLTVTRRTGVSAGFEHSSRFGLVDTRFSVGADHRFSDDLDGDVRLGVTPDMDFLARRMLAVNASLRARRGTPEWPATFLLPGFRMSEYGLGTAQTVSLGVRQYINNRLSVTPRYNLTRSLNGSWHSGWQIRLDGEPSDTRRWWVGYADGRESLSPTLYDFTSALRTRTVFAGTQREFTPTIGMRVDLTREWSSGPADRTAIHVGIITRF